MRAATVCWPTTVLITAIIVDDRDLQSSGLDTVLLKVASRCNINCSYCYVYHMGDDNWTNLAKWMSAGTMDAVCEGLAAVADRQDRCFSVVLHGGEPFLLGAAKLSYLLKNLREVLPASYPISIQTNGVLITRQLLDICSQYQASVAVSLDGPEQVHDKYRVNHQGTGTFQAVIRGIEALKAHPDAGFLYAGLLAVVDPLSDPDEVYQFFKTIGTPSVDFLYKDGNHDRLPLHKSSLVSTEYGSWMTRLLRVYLQDDDPLPIRVLDDMLKVLLGGKVSKEGMGLTDFGIVIIDTDGTIMKNDTLKSAYNGADKFKRPINIKDPGWLEFLESEEFQAYRRMQKPTNVQCLTCRERPVCGGGMILHRWSSENGFDNPSVYCADQLYLIDQMRKELAQFHLNYERV
jgi:uncharacterized protein